MERLSLDSLKEDETCRNCGTKRYYHEIYEQFGGKLPYTYYCKNFETKDNLKYLEMLSKEKEVADYNKI
jgi:hypothetical protein